MRRHRWVLVASLFALGAGKAEAHDGFLLFFLFDRSSRLPPETTLDNTDTNDARFADVDADGDLDIFLVQGSVGFTGRQNRLLINNGRGRFVEETATRLPQKDLNSTHVDFGDIDGDGDLDAIVATATAEQLLVNDGNGFFTDVSVTQLPPPPPALDDITIEVAFADVDGDGDLDFVTANEVPIPGFVGARNRIYINDGTGTFSDQTVARLPVVLDQSAGLAFGDVDGDGDKDLYIANDGLDILYINNGTGFFTNETAARIAVLDDTGRHAAFVDLDGDDDLDLFVANGRQEQNRLYFNNGHGVFTDVTARNLPARLDSSTDVVFADFDKDGDFDAYVANAGPSLNDPDRPHALAGEQDAYLENNGRGRFRDRTVLHFPHVEDPSFAADVGDIDGDGDLDVVVGNSVVNGAERLYVQLRLRLH
jgi:hypothetical protein